MGAMSPLHFYADARRWKAARFRAPWETTSLHKSLLLQCALLSKTQHRLHKGALHMENIRHTTITEMLSYSVKAVNKILTTAIATGTVVVCAYQIIQRHVYLPPASEAVCKQCGGMDDSRNLGTSYDSYLMLMSQEHWKTT